MANGLTLRKEVANLQPPELAALRDAFGRMMAFSDTDNRSWVYWSGYHGFPNWFCWHHGRLGQGPPQPVNLFLPWHRAYLLFFEHAAKDQNSDAAIPWWDWTSADSHANGVPQVFTAPKANGDPNPLLKGPVPPVQGKPRRSSRRFPGAPADLPTAQAVNDLMALTSYQDFCLQLEDIHDALHGWTGGQDPRPPQAFGDMGNVGTAAFDPIFWSHHAMIDRIWYLWQLQQGMNNIPNEYLEIPLQPFNLKVSDVLNIRKLGYEYATSEVSIPA